MAEGQIRSEIAANVWNVEVAVGTRFAGGNTIILLESMKMESPVAAPSAGNIARLAVQERETVAEGQVLAVLEQ